MKPWKSLDLFSGIGGITHGLRGLCHPVAYCDIDPHARQVLQARMRTKDLPRAPVCEDVRLMGGNWLAKNNINSRSIDIVVAGFPCTGMSVAGNKRGLKDDESALFFEIMRIVDEVQPKALFFENSAHIVNMGKLGIGQVVHELTKRGYEVRYVLFGANLIGAPHRRRRWYCLALRPDAIGSTVGSGKGYTRFDWSQSSEPDRTAPLPPGPGPKADNKLRQQRLGMSVVPDVVRCAFVHLAQGFKSTPADVWGASVRIEAATSSKSSSVGLTTSYPSAACIRGRTLFAFKDAKTWWNESRDFKLVIDPTAFKTDKAPSVLVSQLQHEPFHVTHWGTPTFSYTDQGNYLTSRTKHVFTSQIKFERKTKSRHLPVSPQFVEWVMGFPPDWTKT
jgi:site-specific DNA-cytosine methylase